ncbi:hypothetical protein, partial [Knoellia koreensis]|uniref:hypothetical protein n=1 Tax=Knoellia koreensis TaxID=2730921 RepID=UPI00197E2EC4
MGGDFGGEGGAVEVVGWVGGGAFAGGVGPLDDAAGVQDGSPAEVRLSKCTSWRLKYPARRRCSWVILAVFSAGGKSGTPGVV